MAEHQKTIYFVFALIAAFFSIIMVVHGSPIPAAEETISIPEAAETSRQGRFYGWGGSQANAYASANAGATGMGYPYGGLGYAGASARASANSGSFFGIHGK